MVPQVFFYGVRVQPLCLGYLRKAVKAGRTSADTSIGLVEINWVIWFMVADFDL